MDEIILFENTDHEIKIVSTIVNDKHNGIQIIYRCGIISNTCYFINDKIQYKENYDVKNGTIKMLYYI